MCGGYGGPSPVDEIVGLCEEDGTCGAGQCREVKVCAAADEFVPGKSSDCAAANCGPDLGIGLVLALLVLLWSRRRA